MRRLGLIACLLACCLWPGSNFGSGPSSPSTGSLVLYDNFNGPRIDPAKWNDLAATFGDREIVRQLAPSYQGAGNNRRLHLLEQAYSWQGNDAGTAYGYTSLSFTNPAAIKEISFSVVVSDANITQCQSNPVNSSVSWAGFTGRFFNYGGGTDPNEDVSADVQLERDSWSPNGPLVVRAIVSTGGSLSFWNYQDLGTVNLGQTAMLRVKWDQANGQFLFQLNSNPPVPISYSVSDVSVPFHQVKALTVGHGVPNCTTQPTGSAMMDAYFDNVFVNAN